MTEDFSGLKHCQKLEVFGAQGENFPALKCIFSKAALKVLGQRSPMNWAYWLMIFGGRRTFIQSAIFIIAQGGSLKQHVYYDFRASSFLVFSVHFLSLCIYLLETPCEVKCTLSHPMKSARERFPNVNVFLYAQAMQSLTKSKERALFYGAKYLYLKSLFWGVTKLLKICLFSRFLQFLLSFTYVTLSLGALGVKLIIK